MTETLGLVMLFAVAAAFPASASPSVALSPKTNHPGSTTKVSGSGFGLNKTIDLYWDTADELLVTSDSNGAFSSKSISVPTDSPPGVHWVTASERDNGDGAQAAFTVGTSWVEHGFGPANKRNNPYENVISTSNVKKLDVAWTFTTGDIVESSPAVVNGFVYIGSADGN